MQKMSVAHFHWGFPPIIGGVETHLATLLPEFVKIGHKVALFTSAVGQERVYSIYKGVKISRTPLMDLNWLKNRGLHSLEDDIVKAYNSFLKEIKPDIIHTHNMHYFSESHAHILCRIAKKMKIPFILTAHNVWDDILFLKLIRNVSWTHIIAVSHYIKKELIGVGISDEKVTVIHHGIDTETFSPNKSNSNIIKKYDKLKNKKIIFHPARMGLAKGCDVSIKAINIVKKYFPDVLLILAGTKNIIDWSDTQQKDIAYFLDLVKIFNLQNNVYIDCFNLDEMAELYSLADICLYPSTASEPFGLTMLESLASGTPIIVSDMGGMPEIILNDVNGYVVKVRDYEHVANCIIKLFKDETTRKRLAETGKQMVCKYYTKEIIAEKYLKLYKDVISSNKNMDCLMSSRQ